MIIRELPIYGVDEPDYYEETYGDKFIDAPDRYGLNLNGNEED